MDIIIFQECQNIPCISIADLFSGHLQKKVFKDIPYVLFIPVCLLKECDKIFLTHIQ